MKVKNKCVTPDKSQVRELLFKYIKKAAASVERVEIGLDSSTFKAVTEVGTFFFRCSGKRGNYDVEEAILRLVRKAGMKAPKPIVSDVSRSKYPFHYLILEYRKGSPDYRLNKYQ